MSVIGMGTWLSHGGQQGDESAIKCTRRAYDLGINFFDTANEYQAGRAEEVLGRALGGIRRESFIVGTKVCYPMGDGPLDRGLSRKHILAQVDKSLRRLGLEYIDLYQCHDFDPETPVEETAAAMADLVQSGKVVYWGLSNWTSRQLKDVTAMCHDQGWAIPISNQIQYSALWRLAEKSILPTCDNLGVGALAWSPLAMGVLTGKYKKGQPNSPNTRGRRGVGKLDWLLEKFLDPDVLEAVERFNSLAQESGQTPGQLALRWCLRRRTVSTVITGASSLDQVEENARAGEIHVGDDILSDADRILAAVERTPPAWYPGVMED